MFILDILDGALSVLPVRKEIPSDSPYSLKNYTKIILFPQEILFLSHLILHLRLHQSLNNRKHGFNQNLTLSKLF